MEADRERRIRERAHALWEQGGRQDGHHERDWELATTAIDAEPNAAAGDGGPEAAPPAVAARGKSGKSKPVPDDVAPKTKDKKEKTKDKTKKGRKTAEAVADAPPAKTKPTLDIPPPDDAEGRGRTSSATKSPSTKSPSTKSPST